MANAGPSIRPVFEFLKHVSGTPRRSYLVCSLYGTSFRCFSGGYSQPSVQQSKTIATTVYIHCVSSRFRLKHNEYKRQHYHFRCSHQSLAHLIWNLCNVFAQNSVMVLPCFVAYTFNFMRCSGVTSKFTLFGFSFLEAGQGGLRPRLWSGFCACYSRSRCVAYSDCWPPHCAPLLLVK